MFCALILQNALHALDRISGTIEQMSDPAHEFDIVRPIIPATATTLHRFDLRKTRLPKPQYMLRQVKIFGNFANCAVGVGAFVHASPPLNC